MKPVENAVAQPPDPDKIIHQLSVDPHTDDMSLGKTFSLLGLVIVLGVVSGFGLNYINNARGGIGGSKSITGAISKKNDVKESAGIADKKTFKDSAEGVLEEGGDKSGEGSYHLVRPGNKDQTAYLTSSTVDLSKYVGKKVRIYGETFASQSVAWLMDVGFVEVLQ